nr:fimbria/pilus outer membrane usher protein [Smithellaceae bacterium]
MIVITVLIFCVIMPGLPADAQAAEASSAVKKLEYGTAPAASAPTTTSIVVGVFVNTQAKGDFFAELDREHNLYLAAEDARALKLQFPDEKIVIIRGDEQYVPLAALLDVSYTFDEQKLTVAIIGKTTESGKTAVDLFSLKSSVKNIYYPRETSAFLNYGLNYYHTNTSGSQSFSVTNKLGVRTGDVFFVSDSLYTKTSADDKFTRLQSSATYERRNDLQWFVLGDQYASSGELGSTLNIGGFGFSKVYRLDPFYITQPVMDLRGSVIFPTQAEIYLDGVLIGKQTIAPGSFDLKNIYSNTGSHNVEVLLRDPFGNVQKISYLAYFSSQLLREGLHEYSYNIGFLRENYGIESDRYNKPAFSLFHHYGVTNSLNVGVRAEGSDGIYNGGASLSLLVPRAGSFHISLAGSKTNGEAGIAASLQHSYQIGSFNTNVLLRSFSRDYTTVTTLPSPQMTEYEWNVGLGFLLNPLGNFTFSYSNKNAYDDTTTRIFSVNYSRSLYKTISFFATASATHSTDTNYSCFAGLNFEFGQGLRGSAQASSSSGGMNTETLQLQKDMPVGEGLGYRASVSRSETEANITTSYNPYIQYNGKYGIYSLNATINDIYHGASTEMYDLSASGSLVYAGGFFGLSRPVSDSFGIVMVGDKVAGAAVIKDGQDMGKTDSSGRLVVPTLTSYGRNQVTLDAKTIPLDYSISGVNMLLSPSLWSGSCIAFAAQKLHAITGTLLLQKENEKIPLEYVEIAIKIGDRMASYPTGKGGEFYIENALPEEPAAAVTDKYSCRAIAARRQAGGNTIPAGTYPAEVEYKGGRCGFMLTFPATEEAITDRGEIYCTPTGASTNIQKPKPENPRTTRKRAYEVDSSPARSTNEGLTAAFPQGEGVSAGDREINALISRWVTSWTSGDMQEYSDCYASAFKSRHMNRPEWIAYKKAVRQRSANISIRLENLHINGNETDATASFIQYYSSSLLQSKTSKTLDIRKTDGKW